MHHHWVISKDGNVFKDGVIILTRDGGTVDHRVSHDDLVHALELWREHRRRTTNGPPSLRFELQDGAEVLRGQVVTTDEVKHV